MAKKPGRPRKAFVDSATDMKSLVELITEGKEEQTKAKVERKKEILSRQQDVDPKPGPRELKLKEAKALAAARLKEKKKQRKDVNLKTESPFKSNVDKLVGKKKAVSFG